MGNRYAASETEVMFGKLTIFIRVGLGDVSSKRAYLGTLDMIVCHRAALQAGRERNRRPRLGTKWPFQESQWRPQEVMSDIFGASKKDLALQTVRYSFHRSLLTTNIGITKLGAPYIDSIPFHHS